MVLWCGALAKVVCMSSLIECVDLELRVRSVAMLLRNPGLWHRGQRGMMDHLYRVPDQNHHYRHHHPRLLWEMCC